MFSQFIANSSNVKSLEKFINNNQPQINDFIGLSIEEQRKQTNLFEQFVLLDSRVQLLDALDFSNSCNRAFIAFLFDYAERVNASAVVVQLYQIIRKHHLSIGARLEAAMLYLYNIPNNQAYVERFDDICLKLQTAINEEDDDETKAIATFLNYYSSVALNTAPHIQFIQEILSTAQQSVNKYPFLQKESIIESLLLDVNHVEDLYSTIQATIDKLLGKQEKVPISIGRDFCIESNTIYAEKLSQTPKSFDEIRRIAILQLSSLQNKDEIFRSLGRGVSILEQEEQLFSYMSSYGLMHRAKLVLAYSHFPFENTNEDYIEICDWSCGQGMASIVLFEYLSKNNIDLAIKRVTLIEPSEIALKRASLHVRHFNPEIDIRTVLKDMDSLESDDVLCSNESIKFHLFSNILDVNSFSMQHLTTLIKQTFRGVNYFVCVSPYISDIKTARFDSFINSYKQNDQFEILYQDSAGRGEWINNWTKLIKVFRLVI